MIEPPLSPDEPLRLQALNETRQVGSPLDERFERITRLAQRLLQTPIAALSLVAADRQWFKSIQGLTVSETSRAISFCGHTILQDDVFVVPDANKDDRFADNPLVTGNPHIGFYAGCPIRAADGSKIASLCVIDRMPRELSGDDAQILRDLARLAEQELKAAMEDAAHNELMVEVDSVRREAQVDGLTRVWNRKSVFSLLNSELSRSERAGRGLGVIMSDIDHFKKINDTYGHAAGDEVLRQAAKRMLGAIREGDALGRYGGEEFMMVLTECNGLEGARVVAERVRERFAERPFATEFGEIPVTVSLGLVYCDSVAGVDEKSMVRAADALLYRAKRSGRNRVEARSDVTALTAEPEAA